MKVDKKAAISWSAGKDACLAWLRATEQGLAVPTFVTMCEADGLSKAHALAPELIAAQVQAIGAEWRSVRVAPGTYAQAFDAALRRLRDDGHTHMVFGDIDLAAHRDWLVPACARALQALFGAAPGPLDSVFDGLADFIDRHFEPGVLARLARA